MPRFLIEFPADDPERARRFWKELLQTTLASRRPGDGHGWQTEHEGIVFGLHERGQGPGSCQGPLFLARARVIAAQAGLAL